MKKLLALSFIICVSGNSLASSMATTEPAPACLTEEWLDDLTKFIAVDDDSSISAYRKSKKCILLKKGLKVTVIQHPGVFGGKVQFSFRGMKLWTYRRGLVY